MLGKVQAKRIESLEREWYPKVDRCIAVSEADKLIIEEYGGKVSLVENGVDLKYYNESQKVCRGMGGAAGSATGFFRSSEDVATIAGH